MANLLPATIFDPASLQKHVAAALNDIPAGHNGALVGYYLKGGGWRVTMVHRIGGQWSLGGTVGRDAAAGKIDGGIEIRGSW